MKNTDNHNDIIEKRELNDDEKDLVLLMLENGENRAKEYIQELRNISVASKCRCGCASINFALNGIEVSRKGGIDVIADFRYKTKNGNECGAYLFLSDEHLAGLDLWSMDGNEIPKYIPNKSELKKYE